MKRLSYYIAMSLLIITGGCSSYENDQEMQVLELVSSDVIFDTYGGEGQIVAVNKGTLTAVPDKDWIQTSVSGNRVNVTVGPHTELTGRYGLIRLTADGKTVDVPVTQTGNIFSTDTKQVVISWKGGEYPVGYFTAIGISRVDNPMDWLEYEITDGEVILKAGVNQNVYRDGIITLYSGDFSIDIEVKQGVGLYYEQLLGDWTVSSTYTDGNRRQKNMQLTTNVAGSSFYLETFGPFSGTYTYKVAIDYDEETGRMAVTPNQYLGMFGTYTVWVTMANRTNSYHTWDTNIKYIADLDTANLSDPVYTFRDNGVWGDYVIEGFYLYVFTGATPGTGNQGLLDYLGDMVMEKDDTITLL